MALAEDESVPFGIAWIGWIHIENAKIESCEEIRYRHFSADMPCARFKDSSQISPPNVIGHLF